MTSPVLPVLPGAVAPGLPPTQVTTEPRIVGLDLSIRATGVAGKGWTDTIRPTGDDYTRLAVIRDTVREHTRNVDLAVVEGLAYAAHDTNRLSAGLWWLVTFDLTARSIPFAVVPPACRAKYATGRGNAPKDEVLASVVRRFPGYAVADNNAADALVLLAAAYDFYGSPLVTVPETHRAALSGVSWPEWVGQ